MSVLSTNKDHITLLLKEAYEVRIYDLKKSIALSEQALYLSRDFNDPSLIGESLNQLALYFMILGEYDKSNTMAQEAILYYNELGDEKGIADAKYTIAGIYYKTDNYHMGLVYLIDCIQIYKKFEDYHNISRAEKSLGTVYEYFGDTNNAVIAYENAIKAATKAKDLNLESNAYNNLSGVYLKQGKIMSALELIERAIAIKKQTGDTRGLAFSIYGRGKANASLGKFLEAESDYLEAVEIHQSMGERLGLGMAYHKIAVLYTEMGLLKKAKEYVQLGLKHSKDYNIVIIKFKCEYLSYRLAKLENDPSGALRALENYLRQKETVINTQTLKVIENYDLILKMRTMEKEALMEREKAEIIEKKNRAEQSARIRQEFLSIMSHEIRTPMNAITTIIAMFNEKNMAIEERELMELLKISSDNLLKIINDILDFTSLESGQVNLHLSETNFSNLMNTICNTYDAMAKSKHLVLHLEIDPQVASTYLMDATRITQIMGNLITNAIKFTNEGSVKIEISKIAQVDSTDKILFKIKDSGEGMAQEELDRIFESFIQIRPITTRKHGGTGLGLAIVKKIVEMHGSFIEVSSTPGEGSIFSFELALEQAKPQNFITQNITNQLKNKYALIAEDNEINALLIRKLLTKWGVNTDHATTGIQAVEMAKRNNYDFILMDIHMPEMNGFDATKLIKTFDPQKASIPIFALTADITAPTQDEYNFYFNGFLWKPLQIEKLFEALNNIFKT